MYTPNDILDFVEAKTAASRITMDSDIEYDLGCYGDDFHELMEEYADKFKVDMTSYLWYFHTREEGNSSIGGAFFKPPNERVDHIPVTPQMLLEFANKGKWDTQYPEHQLPKRRYDMLINQCLIIILLAVGIYSVFKSC